MAFLTRLIAVLIVVALGGAVAFLATWDMPPPSHTIEQKIPSDRLAD